jgi:hypothetical protein
MGQQRAKWKWLARPPQQRPGAAWPARAPAKSSPRRGEPPILNESAETMLNALVESVVAD